MSFTKGQRGEGIGQQLPMANLQIGSNLKVNILLQRSSPHSISTDCSVWACLLIFREADDSFSSVKSLKLLIFHSIFIIFTWHADQR
jgi:hypothetical protein